MIVGIHHTALSTRDADRLVRFYRDLFGFKVEFDFPWDESNEAFEKSHAVGKTAGRVVMIANGASRLEIFEYAKPAPRADISGPRQRRPRHRALLDRGARHREGVRAAERSRA